LQSIAVGESNSKWQSLLSDERKNFKTETKEAGSTINSDDKLSTDVQ